MKVKKSLLIVTLFISSLNCISQKRDSTKSIYYFSSVTSVTNNGISLIPSFSLGKPATLLLMSFGSRRLLIDNDVRFSLDGKPWNFLFWGRYKLFTDGRFQMSTGANLSLNFRTINHSVNSAPTESMEVRRYLAGELSPIYFITKNTSIGGYYLYSRGVDEGTIKHTHFITLNASFSNIPIRRELYLKINPQVYYLFQDGKNGYYLSSVFSINKKNFPLSVSSIINKVIHTNILPSKDFVWNVSLLYSLSTH